MPSKYASVDYNKMSNLALVNYLDTISAKDFSYVNPDTKVRYFMSKYGKDLIDAIRGTDLFLSAVAAQKITESAYGKSSLAAKHNNFGGIKAMKGFPSVAMDTTEVVKGKTIKTIEKFTIFPTPKEAFRSYVNLLQGNARYAKVFTAKTPEEQILEMAKAGYTTTPPDKYLYTMQGNINRIRKMYPIGKVV